MNFRYNQILIAFILLEQVLCQSIPPFMQHINKTSVKQNTNVLVLDKRNSINNTIPLDSLGSYKFDFSLANVQEDVVMRIESKYPILISVTFNKDLPSDPLVFPSEYQQSEETESYISNLEFSKSFLNFIYGERSSIELKNQNNQAIEVNLTIEYREKNFSVFITVFAVLIGIFILITIVFCVAEYTHSLKAQNQNVSNIPIILPEITPENIPTATTEIAIHIPNDELLTTEDMNNHFPGINYEKLKSSFPQTSCSICLEEMGPGISCHKLYCEHIFHTKCIQAWFKHQLPKYQACCPNCNQDMFQYSFVTYPKDFLL